MRRRTTSYDKSCVGSSRPRLKSHNLQKTPTPRQMADARAAANLVKDLRAPIVPLAVARREAAESKRLARAVAAGRISLRDAIAQLRGCC
jgi:hypothetical protein